MKPNQLPDQPRAGSDRTLATIANVAAICAEEGIDLRYNVIKKRIEIEVPNHRGTSDNRDNATMTAVVSLCAQHGMPTGHVGEYVNAIADRTPFNPVADWIGSRPWDGVDRLPDICATLVEQEGYPAALKRVLVAKWLRSAAAAATVPGYKGRGVLTLQGPQGIGKTSWVKALVGDPALCDAVVKLDHHMDGGDKDSVLGAVSHWIVEIGELDSSFRRDVARLKGFLTRDSDKVRRPYDRRDSEYPRRTVFAASVNAHDFLVDATGNSRWWTIAVDRIDHRHAIDTQQLFAQVAAEVAAGEPWWLGDAEEAVLADWNSRHTAVSVVEDAVHGWLDLEGGTKPQLFTPTELLKVVGIDRPTNPQARECGTLLRELFGAPSRINGRDRWRVPLREPTATDLGVTPPSKKGNAVAPGEVF